MPSGSGRGLEPTSSPSSPRDCHPRRRALATRHPARAARASQPTGWRRPDRPRCSGLTTGRLAPSGSSPAARGLTTGWCRPDPAELLGLTTGRLIPSSRRWDRSALHALQRSREQVGEQHHAHERKGGCRSPWSFDLLNLLIPSKQCVLHYEQASRSRQLAPGLKPKKLRTNKHLNGLTRTQTSSEALSAGRSLLLRGMDICRTTPPRRSSRERMSPGLPRSDGPAKRRGRAREAMGPAKRRGRAREAADP